MQNFKKRYYTVCKKYLRLCCKKKLRFENFRVNFTCPGNKNNELQVRLYVRDKLLTGYTLLHNELH